MMRSMFSGVSGLRVHQIQMDVIGNNISNVNTVGYKASRVTFQEIFNQTLKPAAAPSAGGTRGGINPQQIGLGTSIGSIDVLHTRTGVQRTDKLTDLSIEGDGFFVVSDGLSNYYTRAGNFDIDAAGNLVAPGGLKLMGWKADEETSALPKAINLSNLYMKPSPSLGVCFSGNMGVDKDQLAYTVSIYDSLGREHKINYIFEKDPDTSNPNTWFWKIEAADPDITVTDGTQNDPVSGKDYHGKLVFNDQGDYVDHTVSPATIKISFKDGQVGDIIMTKDDIDMANITQNSSSANIKGKQLNGYAPGVLESISIDSNGYIVGLYSNGMSQDEWKLALAQFSNPGGLTKLGNNLFQKASNSGEPEIDLPGIAGRGVINPGTLEMSNVDLAKEFTDMIVAQRGFQANSRIITTSDELLQELVNLKR